MSANLLVIQCEWAQRRAPCVLLVDDPAPGLNLMPCHEPGRGHVTHIPNAFVARFADVAAEYGICGKFSVVPFPLGLGRLDRRIAQVSPNELAEFLEIVRARIQPQFDMTPEMVTHAAALDVATEALLPDREDVWARGQCARHLAEYIGFGAQILRNVGLEINGVTSPWFFGIEGEGDYCRAIADGCAQAAVKPRERVWFYFLHTTETTPHVTPQVMYLNRAAAEVVVSVPSGAGGHCCAPSSDFAWGTQYGEAACVDALITADGAAGRLIELYERGGCLTFHTHWQALFSNGSQAGLDGLREIARRLAARFGNRVRWTKCSALARYVAAAQTVAVTLQRATETEMELVWESLYACPDFTVTAQLGGDWDLYQVTSDDARLTRLADYSRVNCSNSWTRAGSRVTMCFDLGTRTRLTLKGSWTPARARVWERELGLTRHAAQTF